MIILGGNVIDKFELPVTEKVTFNAEPYHYSYVVLDPHQVYEVQDLGSCCLYFLAGIAIVNNIELTQEGQSVRCENSALKIQNNSYRSEFILAGARDSQSNEELVDFLEFTQLKKIVKPWGYEIWITDEKQSYCLKKIFIKKGNKTSLQFHQLKYETNVIFSGDARLHYSSNNEVPNQEVTNQDIAAYDLKPLSKIAIPPLTLHRLEAITDLLLYEVSTAHLDDVIRVDDETMRPSGRIASEHEPR